MKPRRVSLETPARLLHVMFLAQLVVPILLMADLTTAWLIDGSLWWYGFGTTGQTVFGFCTVWVISILSVYLLGRYSNLVSLVRLKGPLIAVYSVIFSVAVIELLLQMLPEDKVKPALWPPAQQALLEPDPKLMPGVYGGSMFTGNRAGVRGPELDNRDGVYKILTVGGSTTESLYLDDSEEWPHLIMERLNTAQEGVKVWVGNAGQSGRNAVDHLELMVRLPIVLDADLLIFLVGLNDLQSSLAFAGETTQEILEINAAEFGRQVLRGGGYPRPDFPVFKRLKLFDRMKASSAGLVNVLTPTWISERVGVGPGRYIEQRRQMRADAPTVPLPDLKLGLEEYNLRILRIVQKCQASNIRCLFLTQPSMWRPDLNINEKRLLWFGWIGREFEPIGYLSERDAEVAMNVYNNELLTICEEERLECFDLAPEVPKGTTSFYDDVHFNEEGAMTVSRLVSDYLLSRPPFAN